MRKLDPPPARIDISSVSRITSLSKASIYRLMKNGRFPAAQPLMPGGRRVGWLASEVNEWAAAPLDWGPDQINF